jgi:4-amino-4-deoxy-L-arabinose transferase-like glycosyltransferase
MAALLLVAISIVATLSAIDFPLGTLGDEHAKVEAVTTGRTNYFHPLLMIELAQAASLIVQPQDPQSVVELGRLCGALAGGLLVFATFRLARLVLPDLAALAAAAMAATPLVTVHARIFKEDIFLAPLVVLALATLIRLLQAPTPRRAVLLGVFIGLAAGAKYIGALMLPFAVVAIVLVPTPGPPRRLVRALTVAGMAIATFLVVELPALRHLARFSHGMTFEFDHSLKGHDVPLPLNLTWGVFHLSESLWPNLGVPLLVLGLIGLAAPLIAPRERRMPLVLIASFSVFWYAVHEASPLKPYPDFARYMLPLAPLLAILATSFIYELLARRDRLGIVAAATVVVAAIPALWISARTNGVVEDRGP